MGLAQNTPPISAPYNFVPLSDTVVEPDWADRTSHDLPFEDGISGEIRYSLIAHSPLLVSGPQTTNNVKRFFQVSPGSNGYAIHGATLKGMVRAVLEIASFSRMSHTDDARYSVRDLTAGARPFYGNKMTERGTGPNQYRAKAKAGWLQFDASSGEWKLTPCDYARVQHDDLAAFSGNNWWRGVPHCSAREKYNRWAPQSLDIWFDPGPLTWHRHSQGRQLEYRLAGNLGGGATQGTLVLTGQPAPRPKDPARQSGKKHLEFVFFGPLGASTVVPESVMRGFLAIHQPRPQFGYAGEEWAYWRSKARIPVFYLTDSVGGIESLGLALMYKLPYTHTVRQAMPGAHQQDAKPDLATLMFGYAGDDSANKSLKGRVWFEMAQVRSGTAHEAPALVTVLNGPKPSYYPNYIKQAHNKDGNRQVAYRTFMDAQPEIRGWKRYPARPTQGDPTPGTDNVTQTLQPLAAGVTFDGRVVFHNLKPVELGALIWTMTWGGRTDLRHNVGTGKSLGLGQVRIQFDDIHLITNDGSQADTSSKYQEKFVSYMEKHVQSWASSAQIKALCGMAKPEQAKRFPGALRHMSLGDGTRGSNEFQNARKNHRVLAPYPGLAWSRATGPSKQQRGEGPTVWKNVALNLDPGKNEIYVQGPEGNRAFSSGNEATKLRAQLGDDNERRLKRGKLRGDIEVTIIGGKVWKITRIDPQSV